MAFLSTSLNISFTQKFVKFRNNVKCLISLSSISSPTFLATYKICRENAFSSTCLAATCMEAVNVSIPTNTVKKDSQFQGLEDVMVEYIFGKKKATEVAHLVWKNIVKKGDTVIDATCGNGYDTLAMVKLVADTTRRGRVYGMDIQQVAIENTSSFLDQHVTPDEKELVELFAMCHSKMEDIVPVGISVRLVAFNLGYLPGGNKKVITRSETTLPALQAAKRMLAPGGLISIMVYLGHLGGSEELETVQAFASGLPVQNWTCCKLQMLNRPFAPVLVLLVKR